MSSSTGPDAVLVVRAVALAQGGDSVPLHLPQDLAAEADCLVRRIAERT